jgi:hypothetical protein
MLDWHFLGVTWTRSYLFIDHLFYGCEVKDLNAHVALVADADFRALGEEGCINWMNCISNRSHQSPCAF